MTKTAERDEPEDQADLADTDAAPKKPRRVRAKRQALELLRAGTAPDAVIAELRAAGFSQREAERATQRADDRLQDELRTGAAPAEGTAAIEDQDPALERGRKWLGAIAILYMLGGIAFFVITQDVTVLILNLVLAGIQTGLWQWAKTHLLAASVTALVLFVTVHLASAVVDPQTIVQGIVVKVVYVTALAGAIRSALAARDRAAAQP